MGGFSVIASQQRLLDVSVAVAVLLLVAALLIRLIWQPARRLQIIQWSLIGGLLVAVGLVAPWTQYSLGLLGTTEVAHRPHENILPPPLPRSESPKPETAAAEPSIHDVTPQPQAQPRLPVGDSDLANVSAIAAVETSDSQPSRSLSWSTWLVIAYALAALGMVLWLVAGQIGVWRLVNRAASPPASLDAAWQELCAEVAPASGIRRPRNVRLLVSDDLAQPVAVGMFRPAVLLPRWLVDSQAISQLRPVLAHELAHVVHRDARLRWLTAVFQVLFFYQPLFWWLKRELRLCQEYLADAHAASCSKSPTEYAAQLVALLNAAPKNYPRPLPAIGIVEGRSELFRRIRMLTAPPRKLELQINRRWKIVTAAAMLVLGPALGLVTLQAADAPPPKKPQQIEVAAADEPKKIDETAKPNLPEFRFQIVDTRGKPVVGAQVDAWAFSFNNGSSGAPDEKFMPSGKTDANGVVNLVLAAQGDATVSQAVLQHFYDQGIRRVALRIEHPDHPMLSEYFWVGAEDPIVLQDSTTLDIRAHRADNGKPLTRLYPSLSGPYVDWSEADGVLTVRRVDLHSEQGARWLRVVHVPETGPAWFGDVINVRKLAGKPVSIDTKLKPGVRVEGRLGDEVPRPVIDGKVIATIVGSGDEGTNAYWQATAELNPDGTFVIESLPADENLQLIAICDGWVSSNPTQAELDAYGEKYGFKNTDNNSVQTTMVCPQMLRLEGEVLKPTVSMQRTCTCEVTVVDQDGQPIPDVMVAFCPNELSYHGGTSLVGTGSDVLTTIREKLKTGNHRPERKREEPGSRYTTTTNQQGIAVVRNLPAGNANDPKAQRDSMFLLWREGYVAVSSFPSYALGEMTPPVIAKLSPGEVVKVTARMHKVRTVMQAAAGQAEFPDVASDELAGRVIDEQGKPIEGVKVLVWEQDGDKIRSDKDGVFRHKFDDLQGDDRHLLVRLIKPGYAPFLVVDWKLGQKNQTVVLSDKTYFEGTVTGPDGKPVAEALIRANQGQKDENPAASIGEIWTETRTDAMGKYKLLVQPDSYAIEIRAPGIGTARIPKDDRNPKKATTNEELARLLKSPKIAIERDEAKRLDVQLDAGVEFSAKVIDLATGKPVPNVRLWHWQYPGIEGRTDNDGIVRIPNMPEGEFTFMIDAPKHYVRGWSDEISQRSKDWHERYARQRNRNVIERYDLDSGLPFDLQSGMPQITIELEPGVTITGRVLDPDGEPVVEATVAPVRTGQGRSLTGDTSYSEKTIGGGFFTVVLPPSDGGKYNLMVHDGEYHKWRHWANGVGPAFETKPGQAIDNVELRLTRPGIVRGRVVDKFGQPAANVYVQTTADDGLENSYYNPSVRSDKEGRFELPYVRPGKHRLHGWMQVRGDEEDEAKFPLIEVTAGKTTDVGDIVIPRQFQDGG